MNMITKSFKKVTALLLAVVLVLGVFPIVAFAEAPTVVTGMDSITGNAATPAASSGDPAAIPYTADVSAWFEDTDGDPLTYSIVSSDASGTVNLVASTGVLTYTPAAEDADAMKTIVVKANDGTDDSTGNVSISISVDAVPADTSTELVVSTPTANPAGGAYNTDPIVTLSTTTAGATIYYTFDGSDPITSVTRQTYNGPFSARIPTDIKAYATKASMTDSAVMTAYYSKYVSNNSGNNISSNNSGSSHSTNPDNISRLLAKESTALYVPQREVQALANMPDKNNVLKATITKEMVQQAIDKATAKAKADGREGYGYDLEFNFTTQEFISSINTTFSGDVLALLQSADVKNVGVTTNAFEFSFDTAAVKEIRKQATGSVTLSASRTTKLSNAAMTFIGIHPAWDITIKDSAGTNISDLKAGIAKIGIAYKRENPNSNEEKPKIIVIHDDIKGGPQALNESS